MTLISKGCFLICLFSFETIMNDSEFLASNHSISIAKRVKKGNKRSKNINEKNQVSRKTLNIPQFV